MRRRYWLVIIIATIILAIVISIIESNNQMPRDRHIERISLVTHSSYECDNSINNCEIVSDMTDNIIYNNTHTIEYYFLSYDMLSDANIADQTKYYDDYFVGGALPDSDYLVEFVDYQRMRSDYPDIDEYITSNGNSGMTTAEYQTFLDQHLAEYTVTKHPHMQYIFVHCKLTNVSNGPIDEYINSLRVVGVRDSIIVGIGEFDCYFDSPQHTDGEDRIHSFFLYTFHEPGESIECVIGCELRDDYFNLSEDNHYYIGFLPIGIESYDQFDPSIDDGFVDLALLQREM